jgi:hypothetical protein
VVAANAKSFTSAAARLGEVVVTEFQIVVSIVPVVTV